MANQVFLVQNDGKVIQDLKELSEKTNDIPTILFKSDLGVFKVRLDIVGGLEVEKVSGHDPHRTNKIHITPVNTTELLIA